MALIVLNVNGSEHRVEVSPDMPLLWVLRDTLRLTGTKFGCGISLCGACTVHLDGQAVRSCVTPVAAVVGRKVTTIEGLASSPGNPVLKAWIEEEASQCGYCQPGFIMAAAALLSEKPHPTDADIDRTLSGNFCRCGTYQRVRRAIHRAADSDRPMPEQKRATGDTR